MKYGLREAPHVPGVSYQRLRRRTKYQAKPRTTSLEEMGVAGCLVTLEGLLLLVLILLAAVVPWAVLA